MHWPADMHPVPNRKNTLCIVSCKQKESLTPTAQEKDYGNQESDLLSYLPAADGKCCLLVCAARPEGNVTSDGGAANTTVVALAPAMDWSATFDPNQPGAAASSGGSSGSDAASPSSANSWLPNFPSDLFYPSVRTPLPHASLQTCCAHAIFIRRAKILPAARSCNAHVWQMNNELQ